MEISRIRHLSTHFLFAGILATVLMASLILALTSVAHGQDAPNIEPLVARVHFTSQTELQQLAATLDVWEVNHVDGYVLALIDSAQQENLADQGFEVESDVAETERMRAVRRLATPAATDAGIPGFACYRTVEETYNDLAALADAYPDLAQWVDIGDSWDKTVPDNAIDGYDLQALVVTNHGSNAPKSVLYLMAAIHSRELATAELVTRFGERLVTEYGQDPDITWLLDNNEVHILPMANPDGRKFAEQLAYWRKNTNNLDGCLDPESYGVDLNRNSSFKWNQCEGYNCSSSMACGITFRGSGPASEPEVQAFQEYGLSLFADQRGPDDDAAAPDDATGLFLTIHSYGKLVLYPWGWSQTPSPNAVQLRTLGRKFGAYTGYSVCQVSQPGCIYQVDGSSEDWVYGELGVAGYTFEIGTTFFQSCSSFENGILDVNMDALLYGLKAARRPYQTPAGPEALDVTVDAPAISAGQIITLMARLDDSRYESNGFGIEPTQTISAAHYSIAAPSWITGTETFTMTAVDGAFDDEVEDVVAVIDTGGWTTGRHLILVEGQDADGNWGVPAAQFVHIVDSALGMQVTPSVLRTSATPGEVISYTATLTNTGAITDAYDIIVGEHLWPTELATETITLPPVTSAALDWAVHVPLSATVGISDTVIIRIRSNAEPALQRSIRATSTASSHHLYFPIVGQ